MNLDGEQRRIAKRIVKIGKQVGASPKELKAAIETGLVESGLRNLPGGDADSQGWRQERASLYKDPQNLDASIRRFFSETSGAKAKYGRAGDLAAAVQRPAAQYRGRYQQRSSDADSILRSVGGGGAPAHSAGTTTTTTSTPGVDNSAARQQLLQQYVLQRNHPDALLGLARGLSGAQDVAPTSETTTTRKVRRKESGAVSAGSRPSGQLTELFYDPTGTGVKRGQKIGPIGGHGDHVHVATGPKQLAAIKKLAVDMGLTITSEAEGFDGDGVHTAGSNHYKGRAVDVGGDPAKLAAFTRRVAKRYRVKL